jgi:hypothetical protein
VNQDIPHDLVPAAEGSCRSVEPAAWRGRRFSAELDRRGLFLRLGQVEAYLCVEEYGAWMFYREPGGFDAQAWRLHLVVGKAPR